VVENLGYTLSAFLRARRSLVHPEDVGFPVDRSRRVAGLRRSEVAQRAGISEEYYLRLEQGRGHQPSEAVLRSLAEALRLDDESLAYMRRVTHGTFPRPAAPDVDPLIRSLIANLDRVPAIVVDGNQDILAANTLARSLGSGMLDPGGNIVLQTFSDRRWRSASRWTEIAGTAVADLRAHGTPADPRLAEIVEVLSLRDPDFPVMWARQDVSPQRAGTVRFSVEPIGWIDLTWQSLDVPGTGQRLRTFWAERGSRAAAALSYLAADADGLPAGPSAGAGDRRG
jgi:transcriptional regulator with XRE-family HTH domain